MMGSFWPLDNLASTVWPTISGESLVLTITTSPVLTTAATVVSSIGRDVVAAGAVTGKTSNEKNAIALAETYDKAAFIMVSPCSAAPL